MKTNIINKEKACLTICLATIFVFIVVFYTIMHPLYIVDTDDWAHLFYTRPIYPMWKGWNPAKVLPEILMPSVCEIAMAFVMPFCHDITKSMCFATAILMGGLITIYIYTFYYLLRKRLGVSGVLSISISFIFFLLHFLIYRGSHQVTNQYAFYSYDVNCYFNYIIPSIVCASLSMYLYATDMLRKIELDSHYMRNGVLFLVIYLALASNLFSNIIFVIFISFDFLYECILRFYRRERFLNILYNNKLHISIIAFWFIILFFEGNGGRSDATPIGETAYSDALIMTLRHAYYFIFNLMNTPFLVIVVFGGGYGLYLIFKKRDKDWVTITTVGLGGIFLSFLYCWLLCGKVDVTYIKRTDVMFGFSFFLLFAFSTLLAYIFSHHKRAMVLIPFFMAFIICQTNTHLRTFRDVHNMNPDKILQLNNRLISDIILAEKMGKSETVIQVPKFANSVNWPMDEYYGNVLRNFLLKYGFITNDINVNVEIKEELVYFYKTQ